MYILDITHFCRSNVLNPQNVRITVPTKRLKSKQRMCTIILNETIIRNY